MCGIVCFQDVRNQDLHRVPITFCASVRTLQIGRKNDALIDPLHYWLNSKVNNRRIGNAVHFIYFTFAEAKDIPNNCKKKVALICKYNFSIHHKIFDVDEQEREKLLGLLYYAHIRRPIVKLLDSLALVKVVHK
jgi:hypothetical protein